VTWNFHKVKKGRLEAYTVQSFQDDVMDKHFRFGRDSNQLIVTLPNDVLPAKVASAKRH